MHVDKILVTLPVTSCKAERAMTTMSRIKIIKSRLRSTMLDDWLSAMLCLASERDVVQQLPGESRREMLVRWAVPELRAGEFLYVRAVQEDGGAAWSSPWFIE